jgi:hypothetical protein
MRSDGTFKIEPRLIRGVWFPVEYQAKTGKIKILSIGEIDAGIDGMPASRYDDMVRVESSFVDAIPGNRKVVILVPDPHVEKHLWRCKQVLKKDLQLEPELSLA